MMERPQMMYPALMKAFLFPTLSDTAPMTMVVRAAVTALAITIAEMSAGAAWNILYMNTLKYMFSTTQAT